MSLVLIESSLRRLAKTFKSLLFETPPPIRWARWCRDPTNGCATMNENIDRAQVDNSLPLPAPLRKKAAPREHSSAPRDEEQAWYVRYLQGLKFDPQPKRTSP